MLRATWRSIGLNWHETLTAGEVGVVAIIASDRDQARNSLRYLKGLAKHPLVAPYVAEAKRDSVSFKTGAEVRVVTASWRATRGYTFLDVVLEECAFYQDESSADPDVELLAAVRPGLLTVPDARVYAISSPYARRGILHSAVQEHWGREGDDVLIFNGSSASFNPTLNVATIQRAFEEDAARAASEYGDAGLVQFRSDVASLFDVAALDACVVRGRYELPPDLSTTHYSAFVDVSGGSADSFTACVAHTEADGLVVVDAIREWKARFDPDVVTASCAEFVRTYGCTTVQGDRYGAAWVTSRFARHGIQYDPAPQSKSELYLGSLPVFNSGRVQLLDLPRAISQLAQLERTSGRGTNKDTVDHPPGAGSHDDVANALAGAIVLALSAAGGGAVDLSGWLSANGGMTKTSVGQTMGDHRWSGGGLLLSEEQIKARENDPGNWDGGDGSISVAPGWPS